MSRPSTSKPRGVCRFYGTSTGCRAGDSCKFLHGKEEKLTPYDKSKRCKFWEAGYCRRGDSCWFIHGPAALSDQSQAEAGPSTSKTKLDVEDDLCSICYEKPSTYGLLVGCSHIFCIKCIREWRTPRDKDSDVIEARDLKKCPLCRQAAKLILPSSHFYSEGSEEKENALAQYKESMARTPCRNFQASLERGRPHCFFGKDCYYQHLNQDGTPHVFKHGIGDLPSQRRRRDRIPEQWLVDALMSFTEEFATINFGIGGTAPPDPWRGGWGDHDTDDEDDDEGSDDEDDFATALAYGTAEISFEAATEFVATSLAQLTDALHERSGNNRRAHFQVNPPILPHQVVPSSREMSLDEYAAFTAPQRESNRPTLHDAEDASTAQPEQETAGRFRTSVAGRESASSRPDFDGEAMAPDLLSGWASTGASNEDDWGHWSTTDAHEQTDETHSNPGFSRRQHRSRRRGGT